MIPNKQKSSSDLMQAVVATGYGAPEVLKCTRLARPEPKSNEILVKVRATNVSAADSMMRRGNPAFARLFLGLRKPKAAIPGTGFSGVVVGIGDEVEKFKLDDQVFGEAGLNFGAHAEYLCVPEDGVVDIKPPTLSFQDACTLCDGPMTSYNFLSRMAKTAPGQTVLINGASGALGTAAVQLAKVFGAHVTAVCSKANHEFVLSLGADKVIDYAKDDFTQHHASYDVIYDTIGKSSYRHSKKALTTKGIYMSPVLTLPLLFQSLWTKLVSSKSAKFDATGMRPAKELRVFLTSLLRLIDTGSLRAVTEKVYQLQEIADAHAHVDTGRKKGSIVVLMDN